MRDPPGADLAEPLRRENDCRGAAVGPMERSVFPSLGPPTTAIAGACLSVKGGSIAKLEFSWRSVDCDDHPGLQLGRSASPSFVDSYRRWLRRFPSPQSWSRRPQHKGVALADASIPAPLLAWACAPPHGDNASREAWFHGDALLASGGSDAGGDPRARPGYELGAGPGAASNGARALTLAPVPWDPARCVNATQRFPPAPRRWPRFQAPRITPAISRPPCRQVQKSSSSRALRSRDLINGIALIRP